MKSTFKKNLFYFKVLYKNLAVAALIVTALFFQQTHARAEISDLVKIAYGSGAAQIGAPKTSGEVLIKNPQALCYDGINSVYIADAVNQKIIKVNVNDLKVSDICDFSKTAAAGKTFIDMAVIDNNIYLLTLKELFKLSPDAKKCEIAAKIGDKEQIKQPRFIFADASGALSLTDEYFENPQIISFDKSGKSVKTVSLKSEEEVYNTYASDGAARFYVNTIVPDGFTVYGINPKKAVLNFKKDPSEKLYVFYAGFIGFDAAKNMYCQTAYSQADGPVVSNYIYKFSRDQKLIKKAVLPLPEEDETLLAKQFLIIKEDFLISYKEDDQGFTLVKIEVK
ncbi:MAG TPA: hypothetical protein PKW98_03245 [Candidatus Wallbacteria bacterium]|nr:MAG: hypothetical protein BWY32_00642 [bacterium ADurb.Bin243]HPG56812.1 hypothetical protein [Candidatus Wallbacteria bacterium]